MCLNYPFSLEFEAKVRDEQNKELLITIKLFITFFITPVNVDTIFS